MIQFSALPETARGESTLYGQAENVVINAVQWLKLGVEAVGATIIVLGILSAGWLFVKALAIRLALARYLALALAF